MIWTDNMLIPKGAVNKYTAELMMDYVYDPKIAAQIAELRLLRVAGQGRRGGDRQARPGRGQRTRSSSRRPTSWPSSTTSSSCRDELETKLNELFADLSGT